MKKFLAISVLLTIFTAFNGCIIHEDPYYPPVNACFVTSGSVYNVNETIYFNNCSDNVVSYQWDFGDGTYSSQAFPSHAYSQKGVYTVKLTAYGQNSQSTVSQSVTINSTTDLDLLVMYYGGTDPVTNCEVSLFENQTDWQNIQNSVAFATTDSNGSVIFVGLNPIIYYIDAYKPADETSFWSNELLGYTTEALIADEVNYYNVYVELLSSGKNPDERKKYEIKKIERTDANDKFRQNIKEKNKVFVK